MKRRALGALLVVGLVSFGLVAGGPATAQGVPEVPENPNIEDPPGDGNYLNDGTFFGQGGKNNTTPADASSVGDILAGWFTHTEDTISAHIQTEAPGPAAPSYVYRVYFAPGGGDDCLAFAGTAPGAGNAGSDPVGTLRSECDGVETLAEGEFVQEEAADGTGIHTITLPRSAHQAFADGSAITTPSAEVRHLAVAVTYPVIDNTEVGTDYEITAPEPAKKARPKKKAKKNPSGQTVRHCNKLKNKKKRQQCKKRARQADKGCAAYEPGEMGAEVEEETTIVTDAATEEEPIEIDVPLGPAGGYLGGPTPDLTDRLQHNVQIDSEAKEVGFWAKLESPVTDDPDLYVYWDNGTQAAVAGGFNQALIAGPTGIGLLDGPDEGGHSGFGYEQIDGLRTADCGGWTLDLVNWLGQGGTYTLTLWLGEIENDPNPRDG